MKSRSDIEKLLNRLEDHIADELESQDLDFKEWNTRSTNDSISLMVKMAVCMANGGGGSIVFGIADKVKGKTQAILGVPVEIDIVKLQKQVYERTDPHITPTFDELAVPEGTGRVLIMHIYPGMPPYTETDGKATIRQGKDCLPFTGTLRRQMIETTG